jgi:hypothetical protein
LPSLVEKWQERANSAVRGAGSASSDAGGTPLKKGEEPPMNADQRRWKGEEPFLSSAFIGGSCFLGLRQGANSGTVLEGRKGAIRRGHSFRESPSESRNRGRRAAANGMIGATRSAS